MARPVQDIFTKYILDADIYSKRYLDTLKDTFEKKNLDTDTFKILSGRKYLDTYTRYNISRYWSLNWSCRIHFLRSCSQRVKKEIM